MSISSRELNTGSVNKVDVSVIIVNYNTKELIYNCIKSIQNNTRNINYEIIVVDNDSKDGSNELIQREFPEVKLVKNGYNLGFGKANNVGRRLAKGKYVFYLNSDTILLNNAIKIFYDYWENNNDDNLFALGTILLDKDGNTIHSGGRFPTYSSIYKYQLHRDITNFIKMFMKFFHLKFLYKKMKSNGSEIVTDFSDVEYITGADLFMKNDQDAEFDTNYFMYYEETDMQYQLFKAGKHAKLLEQPQIIHLSYKENKEIQLARLTDIYIEISSVYYAKKNLGKNGLLLRALIFIDSLNPYVRSKYKTVTKNYKNYLNVKDKY